MKPKNIEINEQFKDALDLMEHTNKNILLTGRAGTGKSTLLHYFVSNTKKQAAVLAPTGVAAVNVGGQTIHSFFGFKPNITLEKVKKTYGLRSEIYKKIDMIIIDEISMVRADLLDCVNKFLRLNAGDKNKPFGGIQMVFIGDLYQLPPVVMGSEKEIFRGYYKSPYFFDSHCFQDIKMQFIELEKVYRQSDSKFIELLNSIRNKSVTDKDLKEINKRLNLSFEPTSSDFYIYLTTTNKMADEINCKELEKIESKLFTFQGNIKGEFDKSYLPTEEELNIKVGSQIMLLNNDEQHRWVNGTVGKVIEITKDVRKIAKNEKEYDTHIVRVEMENGEIVNVGRHKWDLFEFIYNKETGRLESVPIGSFIQYPIRLAWAVTIHKGQGKTFERIIVDIGKGTFTHGQAYVALSRCTSLDGIVLKKPLEKKHIWTDWRVIEFLTNYQYKISEGKLSFEGKLDLIKNAIRQGYNLKMTYLKSNDQKSKRVVAPKNVGKMEYQGKTYTGMEAYCYLRKDERVFRVDRILDIGIAKPEV